MEEVNSGSAGIRLDVVPLHFPHGRQKSFSLYHSILSCFEGVECRLEVVE